MWNEEEETLRDRMGRRRESGEVKKPGERKKKQIVEGREKRG